ncbi:MAG: CopG family transcriptional regulator [Flaviflexus sp.]|uniref:CopG family transcriptional regulator n=2 Tax=Flaviflexus sp. TaxID=1969482 RepID=UPI003F91CF2A
MAMTLRMSEDDDRVLAALAEADGISKQEATIRAIHEVAARRGHAESVAASSARARSRYAELLERLGR